MASIRILRMRIKSLKSTQQMTRSMKMVAAANLRKTQNLYGKAKPLADSCEEILRTVAASGTSVEVNPFLVKRAERKRVCYVLFVGNRGLCGAYNQAILRYLTGILGAEKRDSVLVVCGRWGRDAILKIGIPVERWFHQISDAPDVTSGRELSSFLKQMYLSGQADEVVLVYQKYTSALVQTPGHEVLLPASVLRGRSNLVQEYIYEPNQGNVLERLVELYLDSRVYGVLVEAKTGEHAARMTAMTSATDNADELIGDLRLQLNHARQAAITTEIAEISGGAAVFHSTDES